MPPCRDILLARPSLFGTMADAETLKKFIDSTGCCEGCRRDHLTVELKINRGG